MHVSSHALVCSHGSRDLYELNSQEHSHPQELNAGPDSENYTKSVAEGDATKIIREHIALPLSRQRKPFKI